MNDLDKQPATPEFITGAINKMKNNNRELLKICHYKSDDSFGIIIMGVIILLMTKKLNPDNVIAYCSKRYQAIGAQTTRKAVATHIITAAYYPNAPLCETATTVVSGNREIRRSIFKKVLLAAKAAGRYRDALKIVLNYMAGT